MFSHTCQTIHVVDRKRGGGEGPAYIVSSTLSTVSLPCICFIASLAFSIARSVSLLMLADSMAFICCSNVPICA